MYYDLAAMAIMVVAVVVNLMMIGMMLMFPSPGMIIPLTISHLHFAGGQEYNGYGN